MHVHHCKCEAVQDVYKTNSVLQKNVLYIDNEQTAKIHRHYKIFYFSKNIIPISLQFDKQDIQDKWIWIKFLST